MHSFGMQASQSQGRKDPRRAAKKTQSLQQETPIESINPIIQKINKSPEESIIRPKKYSVMDLITQLKDNKTVTISNFLQSIEDTKKHSLRIYFISTESINSFKEKEKILNIFKQSISSPELFKNETGAVFFQAHEIPTGFICLVNQNLYKEQKAPTILVKLTTTPKNKDAKLAILNKFNINRTDSDKKIEPINSLSFPLETNSELDTIYDTVMAESERIKKLPKKETVTAPITSEPEEEIIPEPVVELVTPEEQQRQKILAEKYEPIIKQIISGESKNKATWWIEKLKVGSLNEKEIKKAKQFFAEQEDKIKKIKEEATISIAPKIIEPPKKMSLENLITQLKNNETVTISDFLQALDDAKNKNLDLYFISDDSINSRSEELQKKIETLFSISASNPDIFKDETGNIQFEAHKIPKGYLCLISTSKHINIYRSSVVFITEERGPNLDKKITILNTFNIKKNGNIDKTINNQEILSLNNQGILAFTIAANTETENLYDSAAATKGVKELIEKKLAIKTESIIIQPTQSSTSTEKGMDIYIIPLKRPLEL